jgi:catechol 2,3-dioxygenase-like lactoylglutathione lyase family enzyme
MIRGLHHVQLAMPRGAEDQARVFYRDVLGFQEMQKPEILQGRGGVWFACLGAEVHLGIEEPFAPAKKAHPAFRVGSLDQVIEHLRVRNVEYHRDVDLPSIRRVYVADPFGNRIELLELVSPATEDK